MLPVRDYVTRRRRKEATTMISTAGGSGVAGADEACFRISQSRLSEWAFFYFPIDLNFAFLCLLHSLSL